MAISSLLSVNCSGWHFNLARHLLGCRYFDFGLGREGVEVIRLPPRSPNLNAFAERFVRSVKSECLSKLVPIGARMLRRALREYMEHYHGERNHQGLDNQLIAPARVRHSQSKGIDRRSRLGGMLNIYQRAVA